jgi:hypothetical protein
MRPHVTISDLQRGVRVFAEKEPRDAMYRISRHLVELHWGSPAHTADALGVLLLTWNQAAYRYGEFRYQSLENFIRRDTGRLDAFRKRRLETISLADYPEVEDVFDGMLEALRSVADTVSPVGAAKALHVLAPRFFPAWDNKIAAAYGLGLQGRVRAGNKYKLFVAEIRVVLEDLEQEAPLPEIEDRLNLLSHFPKTLLKFIDEYNYGRFTKRWIT